MTKFLEVSALQISSLRPEQLISLLRRLLLAEARRAGLAARGVVVPAQIDVPDDGEDGSIEWWDGPDRTDYLPTRRCTFQVKASPSVTPEEWRNEVKNSKGELKQAVADCLAAKGSYLLLSSQPCNRKMTNERIKRIRQGVSEASRDSYPSASIEFYDANRAADWVNLHPAVAVWLVEQTTGVRLTHFRTWDRWALNEDLAEVRFVSAAPNTDQIDQLRSHLAAHRAVARIVGLSGLGKTRLAFEAFRPSATADSIQDSLAATTLYGNAEVGAAEIVSQTQALCDDSAEVVIVIDDCSSQVHARLKQIVRRVDSKLSLLTLDYDPEGTGNEDHLIRVVPSSNEVIKGILEQTCPSLSSADASRVIDFAQGWPQVAVLLGQARLQNSPTLGSLSDSDLAERMVGGRRGVSDEGRDVLRTCAMFDVLGIEGKSKEQMQFAARHLCQIDHRKFYGIVQNFIDRGLVQKRGELIQVQPKPLAIRLASEKWKQIPADEALELFAKNMPPGLTEALCDQLAKLDFLREARQIAESLCGPTGPFGRLEVLNTASGSRCFRSITEANPEAAMSTLVREIGPCSTAELRQFGPGRRNVIWALEKLAFRTGTFSDAMHLLLKLAAAETESWDSNATGQFASKFQMYLSGTEATPELKFRVLDEALVDADPERSRMVVNALGTAMRVGHFSRSGGAEAQGSGPALVDWQPTTHEEIRAYLRNALDRLTRIACSSNEVAPLAKKQIAGNTRGAIRAGIIDDVSTSIREVTSRYGSYWPAALEGVAQALEYDSESMPVDYRGRVERLRDHLLPTSLEARLRLYITDLPWNLFVNEAGGVGERERYARELAREVSQHQDTLYSQLPELLRGEQKQAYPFGHELGQVLRDPKTFIERAIATLRAIPAEQANSALLGGFLAGLELVSRELVDATLDRLADDDAAVPDLARMTSSLRIQSHDLARLCGRIESGRQPTDSVVTLAYGSVLDHLEPASVVPLIETLGRVGGRALWVALEVGMMYAHGDIERIRRLREVLRSIVLADGLLESIPRLQMSEHHLHRAIESLIRSPGGDEEIAVYFANLLVRQRDHADSGKWLHLWDDLLPLLVEAHRDAVWAVFGEALRNDRGFALESVVSGRFSAGSGGGVMGMLEPEFVMTWCRNNPSVGPQFVLRSTPLLEGDRPHRWSSIVQAILEEFGDRDDVLNALGVAMGTFLWSGSLVPYYEQYVEPLSVLKTHGKAKVRAWASEELRRVQKSVEQERKRDAEEDFGRF